MRKALFILASAALILVQGVLSVDASQGTAQPKCDRCACGGSCCMRKGQPAPTPAPAAPAPTVPLKSWLWTAALAAQIFATPASLAGSSFSPPSIQSERVPLYERNCTLLL